MCSSTWVDLFLLRHGIAQERINGVDHPDRPLTVRGRRRTQAVLGHVLQLGVSAERLISSPYARALETARLVHQAGLAPAPEVSQWLAPGADHYALFPFQERSVLLVGHEPDLSALAAALIGASPGALRLRKAGWMHLKLPAGAAEWRGSARLELLLRPGCWPT
ncbi:MAG: phosphohistidine phosphatase SixA [Synechococcus sp.]